MQGKKTDFSEQQLLNIIGMYNSGKTRDEIAKLYNVHGNTIVRLLKSHGINWEKKPHKKIQTTEYEYIGELYKNKISITDIAKKYNVHPTTIRTILHQIGAPIRVGGSMNTENEVLQWKQMYENGWLIKDIAEQYHVHYVTVSERLKDIGVNIDKYTYHFDEHFFDCIDSQEKAYLLGLLLADGCNYPKRNSVLLSLQESDKLLLDQINQMTKNERPLRKNCLSKKSERYKDQYCITWTSKHFCETLNNIGMVPRKTLILEYPKDINNDLNRHLIRGYFDGDGCISLSKNGKFVYINMVGTSMFLNTIKKIILDELDIDVDVKRDMRAKDPICVLRCGKKQENIKILNWLYKDADIFLQRKYDKYQEFLLNNNINNSYLN